MGKEHKITMLDYLSKKTGIPKTWMAEQLGMSKQAFDYALERGLRDDEVQVLESAFRETSHFLEHFKFPNNLKNKHRKEKEAA